MPNLLILTEVQESMRARYKAMLLEQFPQLTINVVGHHTLVEPYIADTDILLCFSPPMADHVVRDAPKLKWIQALGTGVDNIVDLPSLGKEVVVTNIRGIHGAPVSEATIAFMLSLARETCTYATTSPSTGIANQAPAIAASAPRMPKPAANGQRRLKARNKDMGSGLAESISGDSGFAHATAFCHAVERAAGMEAPPRARALRTICLELERLYNHLGDIGAICTDVAFITANMHAMRLKEQVLRLNEQLTGNRLLRGMACLGGVRFDFDAGRQEALVRLLAWLQPEFESLVELIRESSGTRDRLETTGVLKPEVARDLGVVGLAGRASGIDRDLRRDFPHAFYDQVDFSVPVFADGDVQHRLVVRREEIFQSFAIIRQVLSKLPAGPVRGEIGELPADRVALGYVEGWRGEIFHWIRTAPGNRLARCKVKDPSLQNWPALTEAILGNIIADFPVVNKSFNLSYSGTDR